MQNTHHLIIFLTNAWAFHIYIYIVYHRVNFMANTHGMDDLDHMYTLKPGIGSAGAFRWHTTVICLSIDFRF